MKSKMNIKGIIIVAALAIASMFFINMSFAANTGKVNVETANLREEANADSKILEQLSINQEVEILEKSGQWYKVKYNKITGFLRQDLVTTNDEAKDNTTNNNIANVTDTTSEITNTDETKQENNESEEISLGTYKITEDSKLKIVPSINATDIIEVKKDEEVNVTEIINGWACIETIETKGWIRQEKLQTKEVEEAKISEETPQSKEETQESKEETVVQETKLKTQYVKSTTVNLRQEPNTNSAIVTSLKINTSVDVYAEENGWSKVKVKEIAKEGYISTALLSDAKQETSRGTEITRKTTETTATTEEDKSTKTQTATLETPATTGSSSAVSIAQQYLGCKYVYGGSTPSGFDCSGFTSYVYKQCGISLNRTAAGQYNNGIQVAKSELQSGDLVMFGKSGINHVGIYIGGGRMIHAANASRGVTTDTINSGYYATNYVGARRVI